MPEVSNVGARRYAILRKELTWGSYDSGGTDVYLPFWDDGATVRPKNGWISQLHVTGVRGDTHRAHIARDIAGNLVVGVWPELAKKVLDWATVIDVATGDLASYTLTIVDPNVETMRYYGLRVGSLSARISEGEPTLLFTLALQGKWGERLTAGIPSLPSYPADISYILQGGALLLKPDGVTYANRETFKGVDFTLENNLRAGRHVRDPNANLNKTISSLRTGTQRVRGSVDVEHTDEKFTDALLNVSTGALELLFSHPSGATLIVDAGGAAAGSSVPIPVTTNPTGLYSVANEEHVFLETVDKDKRSVAKVTALSTGPNRVTVAVLDRNVAAGDRLYGKALRIRLGNLRVTSADPSGGREANRDQKYEFDTSDDGTGIQFAYAVQTA